MSNFFIPATAFESMAVLMFNGFATIFLLPVMIMDVCYFLPIASLHLLAGKARPRILIAALSDFVVWSLGLGAAVAIVRLIDAFAVELLYRTWSGLLGAGIGVAHTLFSLIRYHKGMRDYYYVHVLEKNLSARQAERYAALRLALQNEELDAKALQNDRSMDYLVRRFAREIEASRQELAEWSEGTRHSADIYFL